MTQVIFDVTTLLVNSNLSVPENQDSIEVVLEKDDFFEVYDTNVLKANLLEVFDAILEKNPRAPVSFSTENSIEKATPEWQDFLKELEAKNISFLIYPVASAAAQPDLGAPKKSKRKHHGENPTNSKRQQEENQVELDFSALNEKSLKEKARATLHLSIGDIQKSCLTFADNEWSKFKALRTSLRNQKSRKTKPSAATLKKKLQASQKELQASQKELQASQGECLELKQQVQLLKHQLLLSEQKRIEAEDECRLLEESVERSNSIRMKILNEKLEQQQTLRTLGLFSNSEAPSGDQGQLTESPGVGLEEFWSSQLG